MLRAEQQSVLQHANAQLIEIRQLELSYYTDFFNGFGTQSALIAGFTLQSLTNTNFADTERNPGTRFFSDVYFISSAVVFAASLHCLLTTVFCSVYGPGLALRGPLGSMVRAVDGMVIEQDAILFSFTLTIISFAVSVIAYFWMVMTDEAAMISTVVVVTGAFVWYYYVIRIVNRFKWKHTSTAWNEKDTTTPKSEASPSSATRIDTDYSGRPNSSTDTVSQEGYLSKKDISTQSLFRDPWARSYFVLVGSHLYSYPSKNDFDKSPDQPITTRPITLNGYLVRTSSIRPYSISLVPIDREDDRRVWDFRCDTLHELTEWTTAFTNSTQIASSETSASK